MTMDKDFLKLLFYNASCDINSDCGLLRKLGNLYERESALDGLWDQLDNKLVALGVDDGTDAVCDELDNLCETRELQGFCNGFRLCAMLFRELEGWPQHGAK